MKCHHRLMYLNDWAPDGVDIKPMEENLAGLVRSL